MNAINGQRIRSGLKRRLHYEDEGSRVMAIHTGLSVTVMGFAIDLDRDEAIRVGKVTVDGVPQDPVSLAAVKVAAELLARRARRFLGLGWRIVEWQPPLEAGSRGA